MAEGPPWGENTFQAIMTDRGDGDFDLELRYATLEWSEWNIGGGRRAATLVGFNADNDAASEC